MKPSKRRKAGGGSMQIVNKEKGIITGHYFNFVAATLNVLDRHKKFNGHFIVMNNEPVHTHLDI